MDTNIIKQPEGYVTRAYSRSGPLAFVVITIIVGSLWYVYQEGGFDFLMRDGGEEQANLPENLLEGDLVFFTKTPLEYLDGSQVYGVAVHSADGVVSDVVPITPELPMSDASMSPQGDKLAVVYNGFGRESSRIEIVTIGTGDRQVIAEALPTDNVFFSEPVWSGDSSTVLYARNSLDYSLPREEVAFKPSARTLVSYSLIDTASTSVGDGIPLGLSYNGSEALFVSSANVVRMTDLSGETYDIATLESFNDLDSAMSLDGQILALIMDDRVAFAALNWDRNAFDTYASFDDVVMSVTFDQNGDAVLLRPDGSMKVYTLGDSWEMQRATYEVNLPLEDNVGVELLRWNNRE